MPSAIETAQQQLARAYAYVDDQVGSPDLDRAQRSATVALELYAAAARLASMTGHVDLVTDRPCTSDADAAARLTDTIAALGDPDSSDLAAAVRHLSEAHRRLTATGAPQ